MSNYHRVSPTDLGKIAREEELEQVRALIQRIGDNLAGFFLLNFFAPPGFGKSILLEQIWLNYEAALPISFVSVTRFVRDGSLELSALLIHILRDLSLRLPRRIADVSEDFLGSAQDVQLADKLIELVRASAASQRTALLLIDDYDAMLPDDRRRFETLVLGRLTSAMRFGAVLTSQVELRFDRIDLRMFLESHELNYLTPEAISTAFPQYSAIAPDLQKITGGLPALAQDFVADLTVAQVSAGEFPTYREELIRRYYRTHVKNLLASIPVDLREAVQVLSLLRRFDVATLRGILPKVLGKPYTGYDTPAYL